MTTPQRWERDETMGDRCVVTLTLEQAGRPVVVLDSELLKSIDGALDEIEREVGGKLGGFVLASASKVFIAGANLREIMDLSDAELDEYLRFGSRVYGRIARLGCTTVAAINGAALGGGLEIAMHCDHLIASKPQPKEPGGPVREYPVGLPEAGLSICPGWGGTVLLPGRMNVAEAIRLTATGETPGVSVMAGHGLIEQMCEPGALLGRAKELASSPKKDARTEPVAITNADRRGAGREGLASVRGTLANTGSARAVVECVEAGLRDGWEGALACERASLIRLRNSAEGRAAIEAFFAKSARA